MFNNASFMYKWVVLAVIVIAFMFAAASQLAVVSPSIPVFMEVFNINATIAGLLTSVWALARVIISLPVGGIATRFGGRVAYMIGIASSILGWALIVVAPNYLAVLAGRFIMGFGAGAMSVAGPIIISEWFPRSKLSTAMGFWAVAMPLGILWELPLIAWLISTWGWRQAYALFLILSVSTLIPLTIVLRRPPPHPLRVEHAIKFSNISGVLSNHAFIVACISIFFGLGLWSIYSTYVVKWCMVKGYEYMVASLYATLLNVGCVISQVATGLISDKLLGGRQKPTFLVGVFLTSSLTLLLPHTTSELTTSLAIALIGIGIAPVTVAMFAIPIKIAKSEERGIAMGITGMFMYSSYMLTLLAGYVFDTYGLTIACTITAIIGFTSFSVMALGLRVKV
ncbi:MAG: MFS transporter [Sulfolobales archaeon]